MQNYIVKIRLAASGEHLLIRPVGSNDFKLELEGSEASRVADGYGLRPGTECWVDSYVDEHGFLNLGLPHDPEDF